MTHPLVTRLTRDFGYPVLNAPDDVAAFTEAPGAHVVLVPGDAERNLETPDVAVILPELRQAFQGRFDCAVAGDAVETALREGTRVLKTPSLLFFRDGVFVGGIPKVRDWSDYVERTAHLLSADAGAPVPETAE